MSVEVRAVVFTVSDACARGERADASGETLVGLLKQSGAIVVEAIILSDDLAPLAEALKRTAERIDVNLIVTTGGTGLGPRDNTPEATRQILERDAPGLSEAIRSQSLRITPMAMISRGVSGVCSGTLIINFPGSPKAVRESFEVIKPVLSHSVELLAGHTTHRN